MSEKINKSFLTEEAKSDINEMLDNNSGGGSSFTTQIETSEGLTLGKGTVNEESLTAEELSNIKSASGADAISICRILTSAISISAGGNANFTVDGLNTKLKGKLKPNSNYYFMSALYGMVINALNIKQYTGNAGKNYIRVDNDGILHLGSDTTELPDGVSVGVTCYSPSSDTTIPAGSTLNVFFVREA